MAEGRLQPPNRGALWTQLALTQTQLVELCGVTLRQVRYWTDRGYIVPVPERPDRYSGDAIDMCLLIKQGLNHGLPLKRVVALARASLAAERTRQPEVVEVAPPTLAEIVTSLRQAHARLTATLAVIEPNLPREEDAAPANTRDSRSLH